MIYILLENNEEQKIHGILFYQKMHKNSRYFIEHIDVKK